MVRSSEFRLSIAADRTVKGPRLVIEPGLLVVEYDHEEDDGAIVQGQLRFEGVLSVEFRDSACFRAEDVVAAREIRCVERSVYLDSVRQLWAEAVGHHEAKPEEAAMRFRHFTVFFDDAASVNVVAAECIVDPVQT